MSLSGNHCGDIGQPVSHSWLQCQKNNPWCQRRSCVFLITMWSVVTVSWCSLWVCEHNSLFWCLQTHKLFLWILTSLYVGQSASPAQENQPINNAANGNTSSQHTYRHTHTHTTYYLERAVWLCVAQRRCEYSVNRHVTAGVVILLAGLVDIVTVV